MKTYRMTGRVINRQTRSGVADVRVEAWDADRIQPDLVGYALTDKAGAFVPVPRPPSWHG